MKWEERYSHFTQVGDMSITVIYHSMSLTVLYIVRDYAKVECQELTK